MKVQVSPISANFQGQAQITNLDESTRTGRITAKGADPQGSSRASATCQLSTVSRGRRETVVGVIAGVKLQGAMAQFGRTGLTQEVSSQLTKTFASCLGGKLGHSDTREGGRGPESRG